MNYEPPVLTEEEYSALVDNFVDKNSTCYNDARERLFHEEGIVPPYPLYEPYHAHLGNIAVEADSADL